MHADSRPFGVLPDGRAVDAITLRAAAIEVTVLTHGGILASIRVPNAAGDIADVALGFDTLDGWLDDPQYFGALVGRFANRIRGGCFPLDGATVHLTRNRGDHHLHGGTVGFDKMVWSAEPFRSDAAAGVRLGHHSPAGHEGYPGSLDVAVTYTLDGSGALTIQYEAATDAATVVNLTNHVYLNLAGGGTILDHRMAIHAGAFLPVDGATLPTGDVRAVAGTPMDFRSPRAVGDFIHCDDDQLRAAGGYDHCWIVDGEPGLLRPCAEVETDGRRLEVATTQPGVQFYSGNGIRPRRGRAGAAYGPHSGLCLETQHFPDSPNHPAFPSTRLDRGDRFQETTVYRFAPA